MDGFNIATRLSLGNEVCIQKEGGVMATCRQFLLCVALTGLLFGYGCANVKRTHNSETLEIMVSLPNKVVNDTIQSGLNDARTKARLWKPKWRYIGNHSGYREITNEDSISLR
jgi:hypothetical protein